MKEIVSVRLENEMDVILAHKRAMKLGELAGCNLIIQTSIATAVSEISRCAVEHGTKAVLLLNIETLQSKKYLRAEIKDSIDFCSQAIEAINYAKRLIHDVQVTRKVKEFVITLRYQLSFSGTITDARIASIKEYFDKEPPLSPYDEIRRKNQQLQDMADKIRETESDYQILSDTLPLMMFSANNRGQITFTNKWLQDFFGTAPKEINISAWQNFIHPNDLSQFTKDLAILLAKQNAVNGNYRLKNKATGDYLWHMFSIIPMRNEKEIVSGWIGFLVDIHAQKLVEQTLKDNRELKDTQQELYKHQEELERKVIELNRSNYELEQFAHLASHDLQEPLRKLFFYSDILRKRYGSALDEHGMNILSNMTQAAGRMRELIQDLLSYSQLHQQKLIMEEVDLNMIIDEIIKDLDIHIKEKKATIHVAELPTIKGNVLRLTQLFTNLISNSLKYSKKEIPPVVEITSTAVDGKLAVNVRDNGIGFDPDYAEKIFGLFERLHSRDEFPGTGIGLSICKKIAELHGGTITATAKENEYSIFEVHFPVHEEIMAEVNG